jgi:hypothetical protein
MASVQVRTGIRESYPVLMNYTYHAITLGNTEKTANQMTGMRQRGNNETEYISITSVARYKYSYHNHHHRHHHHHHHDHEL